MSQRSPNSPASSSQQAHPLVKLLIADAARHRKCRVLEIGSGQGRHTRELIAAGLEVTAITDNAARAPLPLADAAYDAVLSTHAFFHGRPHEATSLCGRMAQALRSGARLYLTLTSTGDARCGSGTRIDADTYAAQDGPEAGVPHIYFSEASARALLEPAFRIESIREVDVDAIVGRWAHRKPSGMRHWFIVAERA